MKRIMIQCRTLVNRDAVRRESIDGVEHIIVSSSTLPDDIVMNGGLYPAEEIAKSFETLELTLSPVEHPIINGQFISANDPRAIHDFHAGAFNMNVRRENGRVHIEKFINVAEALKTDRGKRLLDRIDELENNSDPRPIHTSVGVFLFPEELDEPQTNAAGDEFTWIARDMMFDHDAILLDSVGAAQPHQGVGVAVNRQGVEYRVDDFEVSTITAARRLPLAPTDTVWDSSAADKRVREAIGAEDAPNAIYGTYHLWFDGDQAENFGAYKLPFVDIIDGERMAVPNALRNAAARLGQTQGPTDDEKERITSIINSYLNQLRDNSDHGMSLTQVHEAVTDAFERSAVDADWIEELFTDKVIFWSRDQLFEVPFVIDEQGLATIVGIPLPVERTVTFTPKTNHSEGEAMKEMIVNALAAAGIDTDGMDDDALFAAYNQLQADQSDGAPAAGGADDNNGIAEVIANAIKPLTEQIDGLKSQLNSEADAEIDRLADLVANSGKYPALDADSLKVLGVDKLKEMAANCQPGFGVSPVLNHSSGQNEQFSAPADMPE